VIRTQRHGTDAIPRLNKPRKKEIDSGAITLRKQYQSGKQAEGSNHEKKHQDHLKHVAPLLFKNTEN
jgi:hypothetical protein